MGDHVVVPRHGADLEHLDDRAIARWRQHTQRLVGPPADSVPSLVAGLLAVQAENHAQASWALACRTAGVTRPALAEMFDQGAILRTHVLRPTWHYVHPDDIAWLLELTAPRILPVLRSAQKELGIDDSMLDRAVDVIVASLSGDGHLTRDELGERLRSEGLPAEGRALGWMATSAELGGLICSGVMDGNGHTYALLEERAPTARRLERDEAVAELALRYFTGHGPATERDLAYWATMTLSDVRAGIASVADRLDSFEHDGRRYWFGDRPPATASGEPRGHLLQILDEYHHGYQDSRWVLDADGVVPRGRAATMGMALVDGQMVADVRRTIRASAVEFQIGFYRALDDAEEATLHAAADRHGRFLGLQPAVMFAPSAHR